MAHIIATLLSGPFSLNPFRTTALMPLRYSMIFFETWNWYHFVLAGDVVIVRYAISLEKVTCYEQAVIPVVYLSVLSNYPEDFQNFFWQKAPLRMSEHWIQQKSHSYHALRFHAYQEAMLGFIAFPLFVKCFSIFLYSKHSRSPQCIARSTPDIELHTKHYPMLGVMLRTGKVYGDVWRFQS